MHMVLRCFFKANTVRCALSTLFHITILNMPVNYIAHQCASASGVLLCKYLEKDERIPDMLMLVTQPVLGV